MNSLPVLLHVPTPGDHFSPRTGSATMTVIDGLSRVHKSAGGTTYVAVSRGSYRDRYESAISVEYDASPLPTLSRRVIDAIGGRFGATRHSVVQAYSEALNVRVPEQPDWTLVHNAPAAAGASKIASCLALYCHNLLFRTYSRRELTQVASRWARILCVSEFLADELVARAPTVAERVRVVPNGVDPLLFTPPAADERAQERPVRLLYVGRVIPEKGVHVLLQALARVPSQNLVVSIVGSHGFSSALPPSRFERRLRSAAAGSGHGVEFVPFQPRPALPALMRNADILVVPSVIAEAFSLTLLEGMASGLACVATRAGGMPAVLANAGLLVERNDARALAGAIQTLVADASLRRQFAVAGRERALQLTWAHSYESLESALS